jgi:hypothetical protein
MPVMAIFDDGCHSNYKSTTVNDTNPSLSHTTCQTRTIHQETALSSSPFHPTHHLVGFLHQDNVHQKLKTPCCCCRHCHLSFAAFQDALPLILKSTPADLENALPSLTRTAKAVCDPPQQAFGLSSTGPTHPPVQDLHRDTGLLENSNRKPRHRLADIDWPHQFDIGYHLLSKIPASFQLEVSFFPSLASIPSSMSLYYNSHSHSPMNAPPNQKTWLTTTSRLN